MMASLGQLKAILAGVALVIGMTTYQALSKWDIGSQALNNADYLGLGGNLTNPLQKAAAIENGFQITTTRVEALIHSLKLAGTGLTLRLDLAAGFAATLAETMKLLGK